MVLNQAYLFTIFLLNGFIIGLIFDFFRILRKSFKTVDFVTYVEDLIFWIITATLILYTIFIFNNGEIRLYMFIAIVLGALIYNLTLSSIIIKVNVMLIKILKKIIIFPIKLFLKPISFIIINIRKNIKNFLKIFSKIKIKIKKPKKVKRRKFLK